MKAILLAAGRARGLHPLTADRPGCLVEVGGVPLIEWQLAALRASGIHDLVLVRGYARGRLSAEGLRVIDNPHWSSTAAGESLRCAAHELHGEVLVARTDLLYHPSVVQAARDCRAPMAAVVSLEGLPLRVAAEGGNDEDDLLRLDDWGRIAKSGGVVGAPSETLARWIGMLRLSPSGSERLRHRLAPAPRQDEVAARRTRGWRADEASLRDLLFEIIERGAAVHSIPARGEWAGIHRRKDLRRAEELIRGEGWDTLRRELDGRRLRRPA